MRSLRSILERDYDDAKMNYYPSYYRQYAEMVKDNDKLKAHVINRINSWLEQIQNNF